MKEHHGTLEHHGTPTSKKRRQHVPNSSTLGHVRGLWDSAHSPSVSTLMMIGVHFTVVHTWFYHFIVNRCK